MDEHILDRPVWQSLASGHAEFAHGGPTARRYRPDISPFVGIVDDSTESLNALSRVVEVGSEIIFPQRFDVPIADGFELINEAPVAQMLAPAPPHPTQHQAGWDEIVQLNGQDVPEMIALATLTNPGPFLSKTSLLGDFFGIRKDGRLVAMAGERFNPPGYREVSAVCTHPDWRGHGFGALLTLFVVRHIALRGEVPFLHCFTDNVAAIRLYQLLDFEVRCEFLARFWRRV